MPTVQQNDECWRNSPEPSELSEADESSSDDERDRRQEQEQLRDDGIYSKYADDEDSSAPAGITLTLLKNPADPQSDSRASPMEAEQVLDDIVRNSHLLTLVTFIIIIIIIIIIILM